MQPRQATPNEIRSALSHGQRNRRVRISQDGAVTYYGSTVDTDRQHDYWHDAGTIETWVVEDGIARSK
jgi:hypothetical protein